MNHLGHFENCNLYATDRNYRNPCCGPPPVYQDLSMHYDRPFKKAIVDLPFRIKGNSKLINQINKINTIWSYHIHIVVLRLPDSWSNWNWKMLVFEERSRRGENRRTRRRTSRSKGENQQQTQPSFRYSLSPLWGQSTRT